MAKKRGFMGIEKHSPNTKKNLLFLTLLVLGSLLVGYCIFIGFMI